MSLEAYAQRIAASALKLERAHYGWDDEREYGWLGSMRSRPAEHVPAGYLAESDSDTPSSNYHYLPSSGTWKRRLGQTQKFDTFGSSLGLLPAKWGAKGRQVEEFISDGITDGIPTVIGLTTKETLANSAKVDDGYFSNVYVRDQVNGLNYTLGSDYSDVSYPVPGTVQPYKLTPLWYDSGDGGITRGVSEFARRFWVSGSRRFQKVGREWHFPSLKGTPSRWRGTFTALAAQLDYARPLAVVAGSGTSWAAAGGATTLLNGINETDSDTSGDYDRFDASLGLGSIIVTLDNQTSLALSGIGDSGHKVHVTLRMSASYAARVVMSIGYNASVAGDTTVVNNIAWGGESNTDHTATNDQGNVTTSFVQYTFTLAASDCATLNTAHKAGKALFLAFINSGTPVSGTMDIAQVEYVIGAVTTPADNRLMPAGPISPCHSGSLAKGNSVTASVTTCRPSADRTDGTWLNASGVNTNLYQSVDDATADDTDYIATPLGSNSTCDIDIAAWGVTPASTDTVTVYFRARRTAVIGSPTVDLNMKLMEVVAGTPTERSSSLQTLTASFQTFSWTMTAGQIATISSWANTFCIRMQTTGADSDDRCFVSMTYATHRASGSSEGGWKGRDRFYFGCAYVYEDDSVWMPTLGRAPNTVLTNGLNLFTVDASNPTASYDKVTWSNLPVPPYGVKRLRLVRSDKIDSTQTDSLELNPLNLRVVADVDAGTTTYEDYLADDDALQLDPDGLLLRLDHAMTPRGRYFFAGEQRACVAYGGVNPTAIELCPVGFSADYDLNVSDTSSTAYASAHAMYMRLDVDSSSVYTLALVCSDGASTVTKSFALATYTTLQKLVDAINATNCATDSMQWRAQLCPAVPGETLSTYLLPHSRAIASCVVSGQTITIPSGTKTAVGALISGTGVTTGAYITSIDSATASSHVVTFSGTITAATKTLTFYFELGDIPTSGTANSGYQRVIANSLPGFLYLRKTYLDLYPIEKSSVWMTSASPESTKSAPNCFSGALTNKFFPPGDAGIAMGGRGVENGFFVPFSLKRAVIENVRDMGTGFDRDFRLRVTNEHSGCVSWMSVYAGTGFAGCAAPEGIVASSLKDEILLSVDIWTPAISEAGTGQGDFSYEIPQSIAATAQDLDAAFLSCRILRSILWVGYRTSASSTHPNRQVPYDFSSGIASRGMNALKRTDKLTWGWGLPMTRSFTAICEGRRTDGTHLYGWNEANAGSTGDGRLDEFEVAETDNGTAISASATTPWLRFGVDKISGQELVVEHATPSGATAAWDFHRSRSDDTYSFTPNTSSSVAWSKDRKLLTLPARAGSDACYVGFRQSAGSAHEVRSLTLYAKRVKDYRPT